MIVGGGPAGAWAAYTLARGGARVTIVDGSHPREKACGGGVTYVDQVMTGCRAETRTRTVSRMVSKMVTREVQEQYTYTEQVPVTEEVRKERIATDPEGGTGRR